ncbi:unnamed protein product [Pylaiella littoralis]
MHFMVEDVFNPETFQCAPSTRPRSSSPYAIRQRDEIHRGAVNKADEGRDFYGYPAHQTHRNTGAGGGATGYGRIPGSFILPSSQQPAQGNGGLPKEQQQRQQEQQQLRSHHHPDFEMRLVLERGACSHSTRQAFVANIPSSGSGWEDPSDSRDAKTLLRQPLPREAGLDGRTIRLRGTPSLDGQQSWEQQPSHGGGAPSVSGYYAALPEISSEHHLSRRPTVSTAQQQQPPDNNSSGRTSKGNYQKVAQQHHGLTPAPVSSFPPEPPRHWEVQAVAPGAGRNGRGIRRRESATPDACSAGGEVYPTQLQQPQRQSRSPWEPRSPQQRHLRSVTAVYPSNGQAHIRGTRPLEEFPSSSFVSRSGSVLNATFEPGSECNIRERQHRVAPVAKPSLSTVAGLAPPPQHADASGIGGGFRHDERRLQEVDKARSDSVSASTRSNSSSSSSSSSRAHTTDCFVDHPGQHDLQSESARGSAYNVRKYAAVPRDNNNPQHQHHQQRLTTRSSASYPSGGDFNGDDGSASDRPTSTRNMTMVEPSSTAIGENRQRLEAVPPGSGSCPQRSRLEKFPLPTPKYTPVGNGLGGNGSADSAAVTTSWPEARAPSLGTLPPTLENPTERLQHLSLGQSMSGSGSGSDDRGAGLPPTQDRGGAAAAAVVVGMCPALDCPAGSDECLPGATPDMLVYEVDFKRATRTFLPGEELDHENIVCGTLVKVEADRGEDLGAVHRSLPLSEYLTALHDEKLAKAAKIAENGGGGGAAGEASESKKKRAKSKKAEEDEKNLGSKQQQQQQQRKVRDEAQEEVVCPVRAMKRILRPADSKELQQLREKSNEEDGILRVCQDKVRQRSLPMKIVDAEYQFDMHKLTLFFEAERRIDFRELVRDLFAVYKTRIWMQQVKDKDAAATQFGALVAASAAAVAATTSSDKYATAAATVGGPDSDEKSAAALELEREAPPSVQSLNTGNLSSAGLAPALDTEHNSGYGSAGSGGDGCCGTGGGSGSGGGSRSGGANSDNNSESDLVGDFTTSWAKEQIAIGEDAGKKSEGNLVATGVDTEQPQQQRRRPQQVSRSSSYSSLLEGFDAGGIATAVDTGPQQQQRHRKQQQQVVSASSYLYPDMHERFHVGGIAAAIDSELPQQHHRQVASASSYPDLFDVRGNVDGEQHRRQQHHRQQQQHDRQSQQQLASTSPYPNLLEEFDVGGIADRELPQQRHSQHHHQQQQQQQQHRQHRQPQEQTASTSWCLDLLEEFEVGGIAAAMDAELLQHHWQQRRQPQTQMASTSSYPDLPEDYDAGAIASANPRQQRRHQQQQHHHQQQRHQQGQHQQQVAPTSSYPDLVQEFKAGRFADSMSTKQQQKHHPHSHGHNHPPAPSYPDVVQGLDFLSFA